jgi:branched-chain amino acid transport system ATP-binding protein
MSAEALLRVEALRKRFGGLVATDDLSLDIRHGEIHAIIGPNGAGKTTLIGQLAGELRPDSGSIMLDGVDITHMPPAQRVRRGLARSFQITSILADSTAADNVALAVQAARGHGFQLWRNARRDPGLRLPATALLAAVGLAERAGTRAGDLAHGEQRQLEIAMVLALKPRLLLLDEPMAGMGSEESQRILALIRSLQGTVAILLVEHDMDTVFALADRITVLVGGRAIVTGSAEEIQAHPEVRAAYLGEEEDA